MPCLLHISVFAGEVTQLKKVPENAVLPRVVGGVPQSGVLVSMTREGSGYLRMGYNRMPTMRFVDVSAWPDTNPGSMYNSCFSLKNKQTKTKKPYVRKTNVEASVVLLYHTDRTVAYEGPKARAHCSARGTAAAGISAPGCKAGSVRTSCSPSPSSQSYSHPAPPKHLGHPAAGQARGHSLRNRSRLGWSAERIDP